MAQAPGGGASQAPRENKTIVDFVGMNTQNERNALDPGQFHWLENIQPIGPGELHSIPGRSSAVVVIPPVILCTDSTERGQHPVTIETRFDQANSFPPTTNLRTSWGYIDATEEVYTLIGQATCGGGNMTYIATCCQINHFQTPSVLTHPVLIDPTVTRPAINSRVGTGDQPVYGFQSNAIGGGGVALYFPLLNAHTDFLQPGGYTGFEVQAFAMKGESVWFCKVNESANSPNRELIEYNRSTGALLNRYTTLTGFFQSCPQLTDSFLYVLCRELVDTDAYSIKRINRADGTLSATFKLDNIGPASIHVANDNLIYIVAAKVEAAIYYVKNFTELVFIGHTTSIGLSPFSSNGFFAGGSIYYGNTGVAGFTTDIFKVAIACPDPAPIIASVNRGAASVAAGATINASWTNVLEPNAFDKIQLHNAPTGDNLGFTAASLINSQFTDGLGTSSITYTIPGGTPPGDYVFMYVALDQVYVATSPTFTVT